MSARRDVTELLRAWNRGEQVLDELMPLVYEELRRAASHYLRQERPGHALQPTALVNEAYLRLVDRRKTNWQGRAHFLGVAAKIMRNILVDRARVRRAQKRDVGQTIALSDAAGSVQQEVDLLGLDEALNRLTGLDPGYGRMVELRFFAGLSIEETATVMGASTATIKRDWVLAKSTLHRYLETQAT
jgi:RNA polymerase sigma factor (TIGR02999 family)